MEMYKEQGLNRKDCELKIMEKYKRPFQIYTQKGIRTGGFLGLFSKQGVEVEFYFTPVSGKNSYNAVYKPQAVPSSWQVSDITESRMRAYSSPDLEDDKRKLIAAAGKNYDAVTEKAAAGGISASQQILDSLNELKEKIVTGAKKEEHSSFTRAAELLKLNDFSETFINGALEKLRKELPLETLDDFDAVQDRLLEWIGESISIYKDERPARKPVIAVLVGPTGVGKTTTISKLAVKYGVSIDDKPADINVRMITIDGYRICGKEQLEILGDVMRVEVSFVTGRDIAETKHALRKEIAINTEGTDLFLIDTIGNSPKDASRLGKMKEILDGAGKNAQFHLVICASTKTSDIEELMRQFEPFNYRSVILTKMDETYRIGNIISALAEKKKPVSFITDGQDVLGDIKPASAAYFLENLDGFNIDREKIKKRFPSAQADQFNWR